MSMLLTIAQTTRCSEVSLVIDMIKPFHFNLHVGWDSVLSVQ